MMITRKPAQRLRIHLAEGDRWEHRPLHEALVEKAFSLGLAGATVLRSPMGYGGKKELRIEKILQLSNNLPLLVEIIDVEEKISPALPEFLRLAPDQLVTIEDLEIITTTEN